LKYTVIWYPLYYRIKIIQTVFLFILSIKLIFYFLKKTYHEKILKLMRLTGWRSLVYITYTWITQSKQVINHLIGISQLPAAIKILLIKSKVINTFFLLKSFPLIKCFPYYIRHFISKYTFFPPLYPIIFLSTPQISNIRHLYECGLKVNLNCSYNFLTLVFRISTSILMAQNHIIWKYKWNSIDCRLISWKTPKLANQSKVFESIFRVKQKCVEYNIISYIIYMYININLH